MEGPGWGASRAAEARRAFGMHRCACDAGHGPGDHVEHCSVSVLPRRDEVAPNTSLEPWKTTRTPTGTALTCTERKCGGRAHRPDTAPDGLCRCVLRERQCKCAQTAHRPDVGAGGRLAPAGRRGSRPERGAGSATDHGSGRIVRKTSWTLDVESWQLPAKNAGLRSSKPLGRTTRNAPVSAAQGLRTCAA